MKAYSIAVQMLTTAPSPARKSIGNLYIKGSVNMGGRDHPIKRNENHASLQFKGYYLLSSVTIKPEF